jgi:hypothetical protein
LSQNDPEAFTAFFFEIAEETYTQITKPQEPSFPSILNFQRPNEDPPRQTRTRTFSISYLNSRTK